MEDSEQVETPTTKQRLVSDTEEDSSSSPITETQPTPSKFYSHFLFKSLVVTLVLVSLPLFPSQAPEFVNQTLIPNRSWELLHLLFVGIAVSYGLFSRRNVDTDKETQVKFDSTQTYVSRILQVSSVFDEEIENPSGSGSGSDEHQIQQAWSSQYYRDVPPRVVVAEHSNNSVLDEQFTNVSVKPLLLPVRSLRSHVLDPNVVESVNGPVQSMGFVSRSGSGSSERVVNGEISEVGDLGFVDLEERFKENVVLPSPIPWRSRSGRMVMNEEMNVAAAPLHSLPAQVEDELGFRSFPSQKHWSSQPNLVPHLLEKLPTSPSLPPEVLLDGVEDMGEKNNSSMFSSVPAQSLSPPLASESSSSITLNASCIGDGFPEEQKEMRRSSKGRKDLRRRSREDFPNSGDMDRMELRLDKSEAMSRTQIIEGSPRGKSVRTIRARERMALAEGGDQVEEHTEKRFKELEAALLEKRGRRRMGGLDQLEEETERRSKEVEAALKEKRKKRTGRSERLEEKTEKRTKEVEAILLEKTGRATAGSAPLPISNGNQSYANGLHATKTAISKHRRKDKKKLMEKVILENEEYSGSDVDEKGNPGSTKEAASDTVSSERSDSNEVDKKADEFIAKFREQIRLQRIQSMKRSNGHESRNSSR